MADPNETQGRRAVVFLSGPPRLAAGSVADAPRRERKKSSAEAFPTGTRQPGEGVGLRPYGNPSKYEKDVVRRTAPSLPPPRNYR